MNWSILSSNITSTCTWTHYKNYSYDINKSILLLILLHYRDMSLYTSCWVWLSYGWVSRHISWPLQLLKVLGNRLQGDMCMSDDWRSIYRFRWYALLINFKNILVQRDNTDKPHMNLTFDLFIISFIQHVALTKDIHSFQFWCKAGGVLFCPTISYTKTMENL